jgi:FixJ family two-component response regulator
VNPASGRNAAAPHHERKQQAQGVRELLARLSRRELKVLAGQTSKQLAKTLGISPRTIDVHRASVMRKLLVGSALRFQRYRPLVGAEVELLDAVAQRVA